MYPLNISHTGEDFLFLTSLLHEKQDSRRITFGDIEPLYKHYAGVTQFDASVGTDVVVLSKLYSVCDDITTSDTKLENKIVLSIGIRHKAEEYIIQQIPIILHKIHKFHICSSIILFIFSP